MSFAFIGGLIVGVIYGELFSRWKTFERMAVTQNLQFADNDLIASEVLDIDFKRAQITQVIRRNFSDAEAITAVFEIGWTLPNDIDSGVQLREREFYIRDKSGKSSLSPVRFHELEIARLKEIASSTTSFVRHEDIDEILKRHQKYLERTGQWAPCSLFFRSVESALIHQRHCDLANYLTAQPFPVRALLSRLLSTRRQDRQH